MNYYNELVKKSVINENYAEKTHSDLRNTYLINCDKIEDFYYDTLFYLHLHTSLYVELLKYNKDNNFDITSFNTLWSNLNIQFDTSTGSSDSSSYFRITGFTISNKGSGYSGSTVPIMYTPHTGSAENIGTATITTGGFPLSHTNSSTTNNIVENISSGSNSDIQTGDIVTIPSPIGGTYAIGRITVSSTGSIRSITIDFSSNRGSLYSSSSSYTNLSVTNSNSNARSTTLTLNNIIPTGYISSTSVSDSNRRYRSEGTYTIQSTEATGGTNASIVPITTIGTVGELNRTDNTFIFYMNIFNNNLTTTLGYYSDAISSDITNKIPRITNISGFLSRPTPNIFIDNTKDDSTTTGLYTRTSLINNSEVSEHERQRNFTKILKNILDQEVTNILGYLAYQIRYYNVIILNTSIQRYIYKYYLNDNTISMSNSGIFQNDGIPKTNLDTIITHINNMKTNLDNIKIDIQKNLNVFSDSKGNYISKIEDLNNNEAEYIKTQDALNNTAKNYNQYYNNYNKLKIYSSSIIIFLVILIITTIAITILPFFNINSKNTYYILILILLIILTILFYINFSHVSLYEKFVNLDINCTLVNTYNTNSRIASTNNINRENNYNFFNKITEALIEYNNTYKSLSGQMSSGIYTTDNQSFEKDADDYLTKMYIDKKRKIDLFRIKRISLVNLIEAMKQQIIYLFNIIFIICLLIIILLISLIIYNNMPESMSLIITFASIAIIILIIYYIYAVIQPTRLIANKNYWANKNPSEETYTKL